MQGETASRILAEVDTIKHAFSRSMACAWQNAHRELLHLEHTTLHTDAPNLLQQLRRVKCVGQARSKEKTLGTVGWLRVCQPALLRSLLVALKES